MTSPYFYPFVDSHAHIYADDFEHDLSEIMERALASGLRHIIMPSIDSYSYTSMMDVHKRYPELTSVCIGIHPTHINDDYQAELGFVRTQLEDGERFVAIGEIGLDYYHDTTYRTEQIEAFRAQMALAQAHNLPIIIHTRSAFADTFGCLRTPEAKGLKGVFHSFTGEEADLEEALSFEGFMIGINGVATFKNSCLREYIGQIPLERLLIETDAPYLSPAPLRGKRNEPSHLVHLLMHIAPLWGLTPTELAEATTRNAEHLFALPHPCK